MSRNAESPRQVLRVLAAVSFCVAGANHFWHPAFYEAIIPPAFPQPHLLVVISGIAEICGGAGLLVSGLRRAAGWGLIALLIAVFPANIYMALSPTAAAAAAGMHLPGWVLWGRLPLQGLIIAWVWYVALFSAQGEHGR